MVLLNLQYTLLSLCWRHVFQRVPEHVAAQTLAQSRLRAPTAAGDTQQAVQTTNLSSEISTCLVVCIPPGWLLR